jgi:hypothetical protein
VNEELLAQLVEITSVVAADKRLKKPITIPRPDHIQRQNKAAKSGVDHIEGNPYAQGISVLASTARAKAVTR